jgi:hypothetical protein
VAARRRDLKVIVTSATLNADRFSEFFGGAQCDTAVMMFLTLYRLPPSFNGCSLVILGHAFCWCLYTAIPYDCGRQEHHRRVRSALVLCSLSLIEAKPSAILPPHDYSNLILCYSMLPPASLLLLLHLCRRAHLPHSWENIPCGEILLQVPMRRLCRRCSEAGKSTTC